MNNTGNNINQFNNMQVNNTQFNPQVNDTSTPADTGKKKKGLFSKKKDKEENNTVQVQNMVTNMNVPMNNAVPQNNLNMGNMNVQMGNMPYNNNVVNNQPAPKQYQSQNGNQSVQRKPLDNGPQPVNNVPINTIQVNNQNNNQNNNTNPMALNTSTPVEIPIANMNQGTMNNMPVQNNMNQMANNTVPANGQSIQQPVVNTNNMINVMPATNEEKKLDPLKSLENANTVLPVTNTGSMVTSEAVERPIESKKVQTQATNLINMNINKQPSAPVTPIAPVAPVAPIESVTPVAPVTSAASTGFDANTQGEHISLDTRNKQVEEPVVETPTEVEDTDLDDMDDVEFLEYEYGNASVFKRICADIIDQFIVIILVCAVYIAVSMVFVFVNSDVLRIIINIVAIIALSFGNILYRTYNERTGNTIGRKATKTLVLNNEHDQIEVTTALLRTLVASIINGTGIGFIVNVILISTDKDKKGLEDKIFNTEVIDSSI